MERILLNQLNLENKRFWRSFFVCSYPNAYDAEWDISISDMEDEITDEKDLEYWNQFTGWYDSVLDECDGYLEKPAYLETIICADKILKIEFHPGDIVYFINGEKIGNTGPHWNLNVFSFEKLKTILADKDGEILFWLLLPLATVEENERDDAIAYIKNKMKSIFEWNVCEKLAKLVVSQLAGE